MLLNVPVIIIIRFSGINVFGPIYINMYQFGGWVHGLPYISHLLFLKTEILHEQFDLTILFPG